MDKKEIEENSFDLSINRYKKMDYKEVEYEDPKEILRKVEKLEEEIKVGLSDLKNL